MTEVLMQYEGLIRLACFLLMLFTMLIWEWRRPARLLQHPRWLRWSSNFGIVALSTLLVRFILPFVAVGAAVWAEDQQWGLLQQLHVAPWLAFVAAYLLLDMAIYFQHVLAHNVPLFWRFHRVHHADLDYDASTGFRFHPVEIVLSMMFKMLLIVAIGAPAIAVLAFEIVLSMGSVFNHGNVRLPAWLEPWVRAVIVTPDMHRVHHSSTPAETNSNYSFGLSIWDRLFGTYTPRPAQGHNGMEIGLEYWRERKELTLHRLLIMPFLNPEKQKENS